MEPQQQPQAGICGDEAAGEVLMLRKVIEEFNKQSSKQTKQMLWMTGAIAVLTAVMTVLVGVQIYLAIVH